MIFALSLLLLVTQDASPDSTPPPLPIGQLVDSVVCLHDPAQTYALYLPSGYRSDRQWPVLYAFDPAARGGVPVALFREAAEHFGYLVVGSNNSRNGPAEPVFRAIEAVWIDTHARFAIDPKRVYTTGMSGGTFAALTLGTQKAAGIIACAGALDADRLSGNTTGVDWLGIAGIADFNYTGNKVMVHTLADRGVVARFETFEGGHGWPPQDVAARALEWLELSAMRNGRRPGDAAFIDAYLERGVVRSGEAVKNGRFDDAAEEYAALARELRGLKSVGDLASEARRLRETREAKNDREREAKLDRLDHEETRRLFMLVRAQQRPDMRMANAVPVMPQASLPPAYDASSSSTESQGAFSPENAAVSARRELRDRIARLKRDRESANPERSIVARRVIDGFRISALYDGMDQRAKGNPAAAKVAFEFCVEAQPENAYCRYELARAHAALRNKKEALAELRRAVEGGYRDRERIANDPEWEPCQKDPEYLALVSELPPKPR
jgi:dienelactone hydrolase